ncbi:MAG: ABC transporter ATP-binding protein [Usitatibacteraceae bacterium]
MSDVRIRDLSVAIDGADIITALDLDVSESEFLVLLGPSGCGKSTLLNAVAGLIDAKSGTIEIGGMDMTLADPSDRNIGMVFQSYALYPTMSVERNLSFGLRIKGMPKSEIQRRVKRAAEMLQLSDLLDRKPSQLSGGQRQRVAIGRALVREAGVFLFDEPLSNLDAKLRAELRREIKLLHKQLGSTMIYVTHDQAEAMTLGTRIVVMRAGKIQQIGVPAAVYESPDNLFVAEFLGAPGMNFIKGSIAPDGDRTSFLSSVSTIDVSPYKFKQRLQGVKNAILGIRPEHVLVAPQGSLRGTVSLIESMGNHHVVWIEYGAISLAAIVHDLSGVRMEAEIGFEFDTSRLSIFDQTSEQRL